MSFDLIDILALIGERVIRAEWICRFADCVGENAAQLHELSDTGRSITGRELMRIAAGIFQTYDGQFEARDDEAGSPWLVIKAIDSTVFEVWSADLKILRKVRKNFRDVSDLPMDAA